MNALIRLHDAVFGPIERADWLLPTLARFVFAAVLLMYFWMSGMTKLGGSLGGLFSPTFNAFAQIFPRGAEALSYDITQASSFQKVVILAGTWAEFLLPALIIVGLFTRLAALGMIGFIIVQSVTDIVGHGTPVGVWFDRISDSAILDQRALWVLMLLVIVIKGPGPLSLDKILTDRLAR
ncbi:MAG: DoxX family protein [Pseudomonadota bacterium]